MDATCPSTCLTTSSPCSTISMKCVNQALLSSRERRPRSRSSWRRRKRRWSWSHPPHHKVRRFKAWALNNNNCFASYWRSRQSAVSSYTIWISVCITYSISKVKDTILPRFELCYTNTNCKRWITNWKIFSGIYGAAQQRNAITSPIVYWLIMNLELHLLQTTRCAPTESWEITKRLAAIWYLRCRSGGD